MTSGHSMETWCRLRSTPADAALNMAMDEALLESAARLNRPVLRFYGWSTPAASFGYFQRHAEIGRLTPLRPLVRRPTGGGLVPHADDWTYSLVFPPSHAWYRLAARESYLRIHEWLSEAFSMNRISTVLSERDREGPSGQCFVGAERHDLLWQGGKIAGAAQRRNRQGLLIQGSIQPIPAGLLRPQWETAVCSVASRRWGIDWRDLDAGGELSARANHLAASKYGTAAHNERR